MSQTKKGGKGPGHEFWSKRPISNKHGCSPSKANKRLTHKAERREERDMRKGDRFWAIEEAKERVRKADADGEVVDSMEVRRGLMARVSSGEITLERAQEELKKIKRTGRTRNDAFLGKP